MIQRLPIEPLTRHAFAGFGDVLEREGAERRLINDGTTDRFHALSRIELSGKESQAIVSIFTGRRRPFPLQITMLERHPLGSQCFFPLQPFDWLVVVGQSEPYGDRPDLRCFRARGDQGVTYAPNIWHHPLLILRDTQDFLVIDRDGQGQNCEELFFPHAPALVEVTA